MHSLCIWLLNRRCIATHKRLQQKVADQEWPGFNTTLLQFFFQMRCLSFCTTMERQSHCRVTLRCCYMLTPMLWCHLHTDRIVGFRPFLVPCIELFELHSTKNCATFSVEEVVTLSVKQELLVDIAVLMLNEVALMRQHLTG